MANRKVAADVDSGAYIVDVRSLIGKLTRAGVGGKEKERICIDTEEVCCGGIRGVLGVVSFMGTG